MVTEGPASVLRTAETQRKGVERLKELAPQASVFAATVRIRLYYVSLHDLLFEERGGS